MRLSLRREVFALVCFDLFALDSDSRLAVGCERAAIYPQQRKFERVRATSVRSTALRKPSWYAQISETFPQISTSIQRFPKHSLRRSKNFSEIRRYSLRQISPIFKLNRFFFCKKMRTDSPSRLYLGISPTFSSWASFMQHGKELRIPFWARRV